MITTSLPLLEAEVFEIYEMMCPTTSTENILWNLIKTYRNIWKHAAEKILQTLMERVDEYS